MKKRLLVLTSAMMMAASVPAYAGTWQQDTTGWWWQNDDNSYPAGRWEWLDGNGDGVAECYYFDQKGYLLVNTATPDSYQVDENGAWIVNGAVQTRMVDGEKTAGIPEGESRDANGTIVRYIDGIPYYTYAKDDTQGTDGSEVEIDINELAYRIIELVNEERVKAGKDELMVNEELMENAGVRAEEGNFYFRHFRPDGSNFDSVITTEYFCAGENLAGVPYAKGMNLDRVAYAAVDWWLSSSTHKKNMLDARWQNTGIGIYAENNGFCIAQLFVETK